jgi:hypothetical protein
MRVGFGAVLVVCVGCGGVSEDKFAKKYARSSCEVIVDCIDTMPDLDTELMQAFFGDVDSCANLLEAGVYMSDDGCDYDAKAAGDCLADINNATCTDMLAGASPDITACVDVYSGSNCAWFSTGDYDYSTSSSWSTSSTTTTTP